MNEKKKKERRMENEREEEQKQKRIKRIKRIIVFKLDQYYPLTNVDFEHDKYKTPKEVDAIMKHKNNFWSFKLRSTWWIELLLGLLTAYIIILYIYIFAIFVKLGIFKI